MVRFGKQNQPLISIVVYFDTVDKYHNDLTIEQASHYVVYKIMC